MSAYVERARAMAERYGAGRAYLATDDAAVVDEFRRTGGLQANHPRPHACARARARVRACVRAFVRASPVCLPLSPCSRSSHPRFARSPLNASHSLVWAPSVAA